MSPANSKNKITEAALELMLRQGYSATTVDEICETADVSKGSFYHFFKSKQDIAVAALHKFFDEGMEDLMKGEYVTSVDPLERAYGMLDHTAAVAPEHWRRGCLLACFANEMANTDTVLRDEVARLFRKAERAAADILAPLAEAVGRSPEELARQYTAVTQGAIVLSRAYGNPGLIREAVQEFRNSLQVVA